jgi:hypothetical protein
MELSKLFDYDRVQLREQTRVTRPNIVHGHYLYASFALSNSCVNLSTDAFAGAS